jgi:hypothetical protein
MIDKNKVWQVEAGSRIEISEFESKNHDYIWFQDTSDCKKKNVSIEFIMGLWNPYVPASSNFNKNIQKLFID